MKIFNLFIFLTIALSLIGQTKSIDTVLKTNQVIKSDTLQNENFGQVAPDKNDKDLTDYLSAILTPLVAVLAIWIAFRQYRTQRYQVRLDLFERRLKIIENVRETLTEIDKHYSGDGEKINLELFRAAYRHSKYLFSSDIQQYLKTIDSKIGELEGIENELKKNDMAVKQELDQKKEVAIVWLREQRIEHENKFSKFMTLNKI